MAVHRIDLRPDLRKTAGSKPPMVFNGKVIGASDQPEYSAARWLLDNNAALPDDRLETYRGDMFCMSGIVGRLAKWTTEETQHGRPSLRLRRWKAFGAVGVAPGTAKTAPDARGWPEPPEAA